MQRLEDVELLHGFPPYAINVYLLGGVLVDAGRRQDGRRILDQLRGRDVQAHALTHAHPDHQGSSRRVCDALGIPLWCGAGDADAAEDPARMVAQMPRRFPYNLSARFWTGPGCPVARRLREGDEVGSFTVLETPGHTPGQVAFWRASDRTLVLGDVLMNMHPVLLYPILREPIRAYTPDPAQNRRSARRLAALEPALVCFGHGPPLCDTKRFVEFIISLPVEDRSPV